jgi:diacylglycerol kinase family enzyme
MTALAAAFVAQGVEAVFAAGGDGTVGAVASTLTGTSTILGVLPIGTANLWAYELGLLNRLNSLEAVKACLDLQLSGQVRTVDVGEGHGHMFLLWAGVGLDAHVISRIEPRPEIGKRLGQLYFLLAGLWGGLDFRGGPMRITTEQGEMSGTKMLAVVANIQHYAGTDSILDSEARVDDGLFEVWSMDGETYLEGLNHLLRFKQGRHREHPGIQKLRGREISIELERPMPLQFDGEAVEPARRLHIRLLPNALSVFAPKRTVSKIFMEEIEHS